MGIFGFTLDLKQSAILGYGDDISTVDAEYSPEATVGIVIKGEEYSAGVEGSTFYVRTSDYTKGPHILGWRSGIRGDWLRIVRLSLGYEGERNMDDSIEHGFYLSLTGGYPLYQFGEDNEDCVSVPKDPPGALCDTDNPYRWIPRDEDICIYCAGRNDDYNYNGEPINPTTLVIGAGLWSAYLVNSGRGEVGLVAYIGLDV